MTSYERDVVEVDGAEITVGRWGQGGEVVVASHGITANHLSWQRVGELVHGRSDGSVNLVALDHRGRAGSAGAPGPYGLVRHADDLCAVSETLGGSGLVVGHSMGAFVCTLAAERHPGVVDRLVLVDGGLPLPLELPPDADVEAVVQSVIGPALDRLDQRWPDEDSYVEFFTAHPAFQPPNEWSPVAEAYVRYDAVATPDGTVRSSVAKEAVLEDGGAAIVDPHSSSALERIDAPSTILWAPRGILDGTPGLYPPESIAAAGERLAHVTTEFVEECNHYTILLGDAAAGRVADTILRSLDR